MGNRFVLLVTIGWAVGWGLNGLIGVDTGQFVTLAIRYAFIGALGGLATGLALWWAISNLEWEHVSIVVVGWAVSWVIGLVIDEFNSLPIGFAITGVLGGLATALALWRAIPNFEWKQVFAVTAGWGGGWIIGWLVSIAAFVPLTVYLLPSEVTASSRLINLVIQLIALAIGGAVSGAIGGLATELTLWWVSMSESTSNT